jgi:hypothetical protein
MKTHEETLGPEVGRRIKAALATEGFDVKWDGTFAQRIHVTRIDWKKRIAEK